MTNSETIELATNQIGACGHIPNLIAHLSLRVSRYMVKKYGYEQAITLLIKRGKAKIFKY